LEGRLLEAWSALRDRAALLKAAWDAGVQEERYEIGRQADALRAHWNGRRRAEADKLAMNRIGLLRGPRKALLFGRERFSGRASGIRRAWAGAAQEARRRHGTAGRTLAAGAARLFTRAREHLERDAVGLARGPGKLLAIAQGLMENASRVVRLADPLQRGYARVFSAAGKPVAGAAGIADKEAILIRFHDGSVRADVSAREMGT
jgi:exonuclease VII large subunit